MNLLRVDVPATEPQILIKIRFADVDRLGPRDRPESVQHRDGTIGATSTGQFSPPDAPSIIPNQHLIND